MTERVTPTVPSSPSTTPEPEPARGANEILVAVVFHRALALVYLIAWISLARQILVLVGSRGLLPLADFVAAARADDTLSIATFPSLLVWMPGDGPLFWGTIAGALLAVLALCGLRPRLCAALQTVWYLGYVSACRSFLGFQWDNLLLECGLLAAFLPTDRAAPLAHLAFRALLFKLYFESGVAKWQSPLRDWQDGSAMTFYYQTAPLPTALAWYAHQLPRWWHVFESHATLAIELVLPLAIFGPRRARLVAAATFTLFQFVNAATANYGFFCYLSGALHLFLLSGDDLRGLAARVRRLAPGAARRPEGDRPTPSRRSRLHRWAAGVGAATWVFVSLAQAYLHFGPAGQPGPVGRALLPVLELSQSFRIVNAYHLFAAVTRDRIEPELQVRAAGDSDWTAHHLRYKPGDPGRAPPFVAPHQPRVDFLLWFYGISFQRRQPTYVSELLARLCEDPAAVAPLFGSPPVQRPSAVRIVFWDYRFTSPPEKRATGAWWSRREIAATPAVPCDLSGSPGADGGGAAP